MSRIRNLTPHEVVIHLAGGELRLAPEGVAPRATETVVGETTVAHGDVTVPVVLTRLGEVTDLPAQEDGVVLLVSPLAADAAGWRADLVVVDTGPGSVIRDDKGRIVGVRRLRRMAD